MQLAKLIPEICDVTNGPDCAGRLCKKSGLQLVVIECPEAGFSRMIAWVRSSRASGSIRASLCHNRGVRHQWRSDVGSQRLCGHEGSPRRESYSFSFCPRVGLGWAGDDS